MKVSMLLCDAAQQVGGKLYVLGGGWNIARTAQPVSMALAILLEVPWDRANRPMELVARLLDQDGEPVMVDGEPVMAGGSAEVGRPPGVKPGSELNLPVALSFSSVPLEVGDYCWVLHIDGSEVARNSFSVNLRE